MRIAFIVNNYPPRVGGVEFHVRDLAIELTTLGHEVTVYTLAQYPSDSTEGRVRVVRMREYLRIGDVLGFPSLWSAVRIWRQVPLYDAISVHTRFFPLTWLGIAAARTARVPVVLTEHGSDYVGSGSFLVKWGSRTVDISLGRLSHRWATKVLGVSPSVAAFVRRLSGIEASVFYNAIKRPTARVDSVSRPRHLVFVGRMITGKGWREFLEAVSLARAKDSATTGEVLGGGPDIDLVRRSIEELGLVGIVNVRGAVSQQEVYRTLMGSTLVNPTVLSEGFQTTILEALAVGGRVVTYDVPGAGELRAQGAPLVIVRPTPQDLADGVERVSLMEPWQGSNLQSWTWPERAIEYVSILRRIMENRGAVKND